MKDWIMVDVVVLTDSASEITGKDKTARTWNVQTRRTLIRIKDIKCVQDSGKDGFYIKVYDDCSVGYWCKGDYDDFCFALTERSEQRTYIDPPENYIDPTEKKDYGEKEYFAGYREQ